MQTFKFVKCTISWKFNGKLCTLVVQNVWIWGIIEFAGCTKSQKFNGKLCTIYGQIDWIGGKFSMR